MPRIISSVSTRQAPTIPTPTTADLNQTEEVTITEDTPTKRRRRRRGNNSNSRRRHSSNRRRRSRNNTKQ